MRLWLEKIDHMLRGIFKSWMNLLVVVLTSWIEIQRRSFSIIGIYEKIWWVIEWSTKCSLWFHGWDFETWKICLISTSGIVWVTLTFIVHEKSIMEKLQRLGVGDWLLLIVIHANYWQFLSSSYFSRISQSLPIFYNFYTKTFGIF